DPLRQPSDTSQTPLQHSLPPAWQGAPAGRQQVPEIQLPPEQQSVGTEHPATPGAMQQTPSVQTVEIPQHSSGPPHGLPYPVQQTVVVREAGVRAQSPERQQVACGSQAEPRDEHGIVVLVVGVGCDTVITASRLVLLFGLPLSVAVKVTVRVPGVVGTQLKLARAGRSSSGVKVEPGGGLVTFSST